MVHSPSADACVEVYTCHVLFVLCPSVRTQGDARAACSLFTFVEPVFILERDGWRGGWVRPPVVILIEQTTLAKVGDPTTASGRHKFCLPLPYSLHAS